MDFNEVYIAGKHQWERLRERTDEDDFEEILGSGTVVFMNSRHKYISFNQGVIPVIREDGKNIIKTVLDRKQDVYEETLGSKTSSLG